MSTVERRFFSAENLERAVLEAAGHFGVEPERLRYEPVDKRSGFTKRRRVVIRVDPARVTLEPGERVAQAASGEQPGPAAVEAAAELGVAAVPEAPSRLPELAEPPRAAAVAEPPAPERALAPMMPTPTPTAPPEPSLPPARRASRWRQLPRSVEDGLEALPRAAREVEESARQWLNLLLGLADLDLQATIRMGPERLDVSLTGDDAEWLVEDDGEALQALQTLLPRLLDGDADESFVCRVDCNGFQELREERLRLRAHRAAAEVRRTGERAMLEPMMPADRRIVHVALLHDGSVTTESVGRGFFKRVTIRPA